MWRQACSVNLQHGVPCLGGIHDGGQPSWAVLGPAYLHPRVCRGPPGERGASGVRPGPSRCRPSSSSAPRPAYARSVARTGISSHRRRRDPMPHRAPCHCSTPPLRPLPALTWVIPSRSSSRFQQNLAVSPYSSRHCNTGRAMRWTSPSLPAAAAASNPISASGLDRPGGTRHAPPSTPLILRGTLEEAPAVP